MATRLPRTPASSPLVWRRTASATPLQRRRTVVTRSRVVDRAAGVLLLAGAFASQLGAYMFGIRGGESEVAEKLFLSWGSGAASLAFLGTERGLFMSSMVLSALGFCLLDGRRYRPGAYVFMRLGVAGYLAASIIGVVAETLEL